jgi:hypothetical protein
MYFTYLFDLPSKVANLNSLCDLKMAFARFRNRSPITWYAVQETKSLGVVKTKN